MDNFFQLVNLPMPPSSNHQYQARSLPGRHAKSYAGPKKEGYSMAMISPTTALKNFEKDLKERWKKEESNLIALYKCRALLRNWMLHGKYIGVDTWAFFPYLRLFTQEGLPRKMDGTNRIKALHDCLSEMLEIDDSWFWDAGVRKRVDQKDREFCVVQFFPVEPLTLQQMKERGAI